MNTLDKYSELSVATCGDPTGMGASGSVTEAETTDKSTTPCRKYPRADFHDYNGGMYFVTVCTHDKCHYFGKIDDGKNDFIENRESVGRGFERMSRAFS